MKAGLTLLVFAALAAASLAHAKGSPDLIVISGGGLARAVEITDPASLRAFDPWSGQFADWKQDAVAEPACYRQSYEVLFYMKWPGRKSPLDRGELKMIYATRYCFADGAGYVYLPRPGERNYAESNGTIIRADRSGNWSHSMPGWDALIRNALALKEQPAQADMILIAGGELKQPLQVTDGEALRNFDPWSAQFVDWERLTEGMRCGWEYEVRFFRRGVERKTPYDPYGFNMVYGVRYCLDENGGPGYIHLAGRNDKFGPENVVNAWDARHAGKWYPATAEWDKLIRTTVKSHPH